MKKKYTGKECFRCGSVAQIFVDMGKAGMIGFCPLCWIGLAGAMARDFEVFKDFGLDYLKELHKAYKRMDYFKGDK